MTYNRANYQTKTFAEAAEELEAEYEELENRSNHRDFIRVTLIHNLKSGDLKGKDAHEIAAEFLSLFFPIEWEKLKGAGVVDGLKATEEQAAMLSVVKDQSAQLFEACVKAMYEREQIDSGFMLNLGRGEDDATNSRQFDSPEAIIARSIGGVEGPTITFTGDLGYLKHPYKHLFHEGREQTLRIEPDECGDILEVRLKVLEVKVIEAGERKEENDDQNRSS